MAENRKLLDKNVSPSWKPVAALENRKPGMPFSDLLWHVLVSLGGLAIVAGGIGVFLFLPFRRLGIGIMAGGLIVFVKGFPSQAQRNGYRE